MPKSGVVKSEILGGRTQAPIFFKGPWVIPVCIQGWELLLEEKFIDSIRG